MAALAGTVTVVQRGEYGNHRLGATDWVGDESAGPVGCAVAVTGDCCEPRRRFDVRAECYPVSPLAVAPKPLIEAITSRGLASRDVIADAEVRHHPGAVVFSTTTSDCRTRSRNSLLRPRPVARLSESPRLLRFISLRSGAVPVHLPESRRDSGWRASRASLPARS